ncbi:hypothetical protein PFMC_01911 [Plasmodium falciparum CAMP/Malaysia]|uniref:Uncharacterized protein n=1 Tax=Plasmodium falciparum (isolate Camp / Malaysia) TaxID=5835 RepID=A0A024X9Q7_PLAFC|nr:hypothetical protein PFMC_01911 [Plasmodium falciparum CAMP/Malaysia]
MSSIIIIRLNKHTTILSTTILSTTILSTTILSKIILSKIILSKINFIIIIIIQMTSPSKH